MTADSSYVDGLHVQTEGDGENSLLFVHGYVCAHEDWDSQLAHFRNRYTCAALDLPGHGASASPTPCLGDPMEVVGAAVNRIKQTLPGKVVLVGHSLGCKVIREAWRQDEARVAGMVFVDGSLYLGRRDTVLERARASVEQAGVLAFLDQLVQNMFPAGSDPDVVARVWQRAQRLDPAFAQALFLSSVEWDMAHAVQTLREFDQPALAVQCMAFDTSFSWRSMQPGDTTPFMTVVRTLVVAGEAEVLPGSGHFPMFDRPAALNAIIGSFLDRLPNFA